MNYSLSGVYVGPHRLTVPACHECKSRFTPFLKQGWAETLDSGKRAENDTKKNLAAESELRAGPKLWILEIPAGLLIVLSVTTATVPRSTPKSCLGVSRD